MFTFSVRSDVVHAGRDECGYPIEALAYYVLAESSSGRRFAHGTTFYDGGVWQAGERAAEHLLARIEEAYAAGVVPDWDQHWLETDPAYGSDAYQGLDNERYFRNREIAEAHDAGEISETEAMRLMMR